MAKRNGRSGESRKNGAGRPTRPETRKSGKVDMRTSNESEKSVPRQLQCKSIVSLILASADGKIVSARPAGWTRAVAQHTPLLSLPAEISDKIWQNYYADHNKAVVYYIRDKAAQLSISDQSQTKLVIKGPDRFLRLTCHKINFETRKWRLAADWAIELVLYRDDRLDLATVFGHKKLSNKLGKIISLRVRGMNSRTVPNIAIPFVPHTFHGQWNWLAGNLCNLKEIHITFDTTRCSHNDPLGRDVNNEADEDARRVEEAWAQFHSGSLDAFYVDHPDIRKLDVKQLAEAMVQHANTSCEIILKCCIQNRDYSGSHRGFSIWNWGSRDWVKFKVMPDKYEAKRRWASGLYEERIVSVPEAASWPASVE